MIFRFFVFERNRRVGIAPTTGDREPSSQSKPTLPAMRAICHFDMPRLRAFPDDVGAERGGRDVADDRNEVEDDVQPDRLLDPGDDEQPLEQLFHRFDALADRLRVGSERREGQPLVARNGHLTRLPGCCSRSVSV